MAMLPIWHLGARMSMFLAPLPSSTLGTTISLLLLGIGDDVYFLMRRFLWFFNLLLSFLWAWYLFRWLCPLILVRILYSGERLCGRQPIGQGHNIPGGSNKGVSSPGSVTRIDISERRKPFLAGSEGGSHGMDTSHNVDSSCKNPRIHSDTHSTWGNRSGNTLHVREFRRNGRAETTTSPKGPKSPPFSPQRHINLTL